MPTVTEDKLFPLPLAPFEQYQLMDDHPLYPKNFFIRFRFSEGFRREALLRSLETALARHPLLQALVRPRGGDRYEWVAAPQTAPRVDWRANADDLRTDGIDLQQEIGFRLFVDQRDDGTDLRAQFHHTCVDGLGAMHFFKDVLAAYHGEITGDRTAFEGRAMQSQRLLRRARFGLTPLDAVRRLPSEAMGLLGAMEYFAHQPVALGADHGSDNGRPDWHFPACCDALLTEQETRTLSLLAKQNQCTVNDVLLRDLYLWLHRWVEHRRPGDRRRVVRIMIPTDLRTAGDSATPAANIVSMVFLDRRPYKFNTPDDLLRSIRWEMNLIKRHRLGITMTNMIDLVRRFPGAMRRLLPEDQCLGTAVLTNMGETTTGVALKRRQRRLVVGDTVLEGIQGSPPVRPLTAASFGLFWYARRLSVELTYDPLRLTPDEGRALLDGYVDQIRRTVDAAGGYRPGQPR